MTNIDSPRLLFVVGPTAVGKSEFALKLAEKLDCEIVNADSVQCYKGLEIGSAKLSSDAMGVVPHHLYNLKLPDQTLSIGEFLNHFDQVIADITARKKRALIVGGSGMYITTLFYGLATEIKSDPSLRAELEQIESNKLYSMLQAQDPERASKLHSNDRIRVVRALEILKSNKSSPTKLYGEHTKKSPRYGAEILVLMRSRSELYQRIDQRVTQMFRLGLLDEVTSLLEQYGPTPILTNSIGYRECYEMLQGQYGEEEAVARISKRTRNFAKRQLTYWRNQPLKSGWNTFPGEEDGGVLLGADSASRARKGEVRDGLKVSNLSFGEILNYLNDTQLSKTTSDINLYYLSANQLV